MAFSATKRYESQIGGMKYQVFDLDFDSVTSGTFNTGMVDIIHAQFNNEVTEAAGLLKKNYDGASANRGHVEITSVTANDTGTLLVVGK